MSTEIDPLVRLRREAEEARAAWDREMGRYVDACVGHSVVDQLASGRRMYDRLDAYGAAREALGRAEGAAAMQAKCAVIAETHEQWADMCNDGEGCAGGDDCWATIAAQIRALSPAAPDRREGP